jgi:hypothetical protein
MDIKIEVTVTERRIIRSDQVSSYHFTVFTKCDANKITLEIDDASSIMLSLMPNLGVFDWQSSSTQLDDGGLRLTFLLAYRHAKDTKKSGDPVTKEIIVEIMRGDIKEP